MLFLALRRAGLRITLLYAVVSTVATFSTFAQNSLWVQNPQRWGWGRGTIETATLTVQPKGLYMEYGLFLNFSSRGTALTAATDTTEIVLSFTLPQEAIVTDSWLWVGDTIMQALIQDRLTASRTYESIVRRRQDPSLLTKDGPTNYTLRIYPMLGTQQRRVKLTYYMPLQWSTTNVTAALPTDILLSSQFPPSLKIIFTSDANWTNVEIPEFPDLKFTGTTPLPNTIAEPEMLPGVFARSVPSAGGRYLVATITSASIRLNPTLRFPSPLRNGIFVNHCVNGSESFYQMAILPSIALNVQTTPQKFAIVFDYDHLNTTSSLQTILNNMKQSLLNSLKARDSFNIIYTKANPLSVQRLSSSWIGADSISVERAFSTLQSAGVASLTNLPTVLTEGLQFAQSSTTANTNIFIIANSDRISNQSTAEQLLANYRSMFSPLPPIHTLDFQTSNIRTSEVGYTGNEYFYTILSRASGGLWGHTRSRPFVHALTNGIGEAIENTNIFDFNVTPTDGFTFSRFNIGSNQLSFPFAARNFIFQTGKYRGNPPFRIALSGVRGRNNTPFSQTFTIPVNNTITRDTASQIVWTGAYLRSLESQLYYWWQSSSNISSEILNTSIQNRVLSTRTAFLALEPSDSVHPCITCTNTSSGSMSLS